MRFSKLAIRFFSIILAGILVLCFSACGKTEDETTAQRTEREILENMITSYGANGEKADGTVSGCLNELKTVDETAYTNWSAIMEHWKFDESSDFKMNYYVLPDGLSQSNDLCIIVYGYALNPDGSMRDPLVDRLKVALNSAGKYPNALIAVTGGHTASSNSEASEAGKMAEWLIENGIDESRILIEDESLTTAQNAENTYELLQKEHPEVTQVALISSDYHLSACDTMFYANLVLKAGSPDKTNMEIVANAASKNNSKLTTLFTAGGLIELSGDFDTAYECYQGTYDISKNQD